MRVTRRAELAIFPKEGFATQDRGSTPVGYFAEATRQSAWMCIRFRPMFQLGCRFGWTLPVREDDGLVSGRVWKPVPNFRVMSQVPGSQTSIENVTRLCITDCAQFLSTSSSVEQSPEPLHDPSAMEQLNEIRNLAVGVVEVH